MKEVSKMQEQGGKQRVQINSRRTWLFMIDAECFILSFLLLKVLDTVSGGPAAEGSARRLLDGWPCALVMLTCVMTGRLVGRVYRNVWRYPNVAAYRDMVLSDVCGGVIACLICHFALRGHVSGGYIGLRDSIVIFAMFDVTTLMTRFFYQLFHRQDVTRQFKASRRRKEPDEKCIRVGIVGAGQFGSLLADNMVDNDQLDLVPVCFFDTDPCKIGSRVAGLPVFGEENIAECVKCLQIQQVIIALPGMKPPELDVVCKRYTDAGCLVKIYSASAAGGMVRRLTEQDYTRLLGRPPLELDNPEMRAFYKDKVVLVTGGGGSIGSELCRQIARCRPGKLIILDIYENNAYEIQMELQRTYGKSLDLAVEIGSVRDVDRLSAVFDHYRPDVVFHAAAHKHVPLMEHSNCEAIKNNVIGTYNTANMAEKYGTKRFVLVSTDKAVNPTNVMGASKRMCEMVIQCRRDSETVFAAVRFGNVLGSHGSVIPLFQEQIAAGGPVTVTDREIVRFFMTIPEASQLIMQAGAMAQPGELFVLDMGNPIKIWSLAESLIWMSGYIPGKEIRMKEIGLRPGEKKYEELLYKKDDSNLTVTKSNHIFIARENVPTREEVEVKLDLLRDAVEKAKDDLASDVVRNAMKVAVPTFHEPEEVNKDAGCAAEMQSAKELDLRKGEKISVGG